MEQYNSPFYTEIVPPRRPFPTLPLYFILNWRRTLPHWGAIKEKWTQLDVTYFQLLSRMTHLFGLVATPHVLGDVLDALDGLFDLRWHHRKGHHCVDALWTQLTRNLPHIWRFWALLPMLAGARAFLPSAALHGRELTVPKLQTVEGASSNLLGITTGVSHQCCWFYLFSTG